MNLHRPELYSITIISDCVRVGIVGITVRQMQPPFPHYIMDKIIIWSLSNWFFFSCDLWPCNRQLLHSVPFSITWWYSSSLENLISLEALLQRIKILIISRIKNFLEFVVIIALGRSSLYFEHLNLTSGIKMWVAIVLGDNSLTWMSWYIKSAPMI